MKKNAEIFVEHIWDSIIDIENYTENIKKPDFSKNKMMQDAVIRKIEIIG